MSLGGIFGIERCGLRWSYVDHCNRFDFGLLGGIMTSCLGKPDDPDSYRSGDNGKNPSKSAMDFFIL